MNKRKESWELKYDYNDRLIEEINNRINIINNKIPALIYFNIDNDNRPQYYLNFTDKDGSYSLDIDTFYNNKLEEINAFLYGIEILLQMQQK